MAALRNGSKCSHTTCMLRFFTVLRLAMNTNLIFEIGSNLKNHIYSLAFRGKNKKYAITHSLNFQKTILLCLAHTIILTGPL